jgi:hypothetical protein
MARALGWFSIGLGVAELASPGRVGRMIGLRNHRKIMRAFGAREIASGVGILARPNRAGWLWSRVAGDALDLAFLAAAMRSEESRRNRVAIATAAVAGVTTLDVMASRAARP